MARIALEKMSFYAHHGYYTHEQKRGGNYIVDVSLETDIEQAAKEDDLDDTINYEVIYKICADIMAEPVKLVETVAYRIAHKVKSTFPIAKDIKVAVHKISPELGGPVGSAKITYCVK